MKTGYFLSGASRAGEYAKGATLEYSFIALQLRLFTLVYDENLARTNPFLHSLMTCISWENRNVARVLTVAPKMKKIKRHPHWLGAD